MSAAGNVFQFDGYELRPATEADMPLAERWTDADPDHRDRMCGDYWLEQAPGVDSYVLCRDGQPVFFFRMEQVVRVHIQFGPSENAADFERNRQALESGMRWLQSALEKTPSREIVTDSTSRLLRRFCTGKLGFQVSSNTLSVAVPKVSRIAPGPQTEARRLG